MTGFNGVVQKRAGSVARSLISEGYMLLWRTEYEPEQFVRFKMRHKSNGNFVLVVVTPHRLQIWTNQKLVKNESYPVRDV